MTSDGRPSLPVAAAELAELRVRVEGLPPADRRRYRRRLSGVAGVESDSRRRRILSRISADLDRDEAADRRSQALPGAIHYPDDLPITARRDELLEAIRHRQVVVVAGETGSGKSTQLPKLCLELGRGLDGVIGHTQPRRIAARSIAARIAEELQVPVGGAVGYTVRFGERMSDRTRVRVMTDGILLAEIPRDPDLRRYDTIIIDEAHERTLNIDVLLGYLRTLLPRRPDLKVIVTSATIDTARFSRHFDDAPVVEVSGRAHPIEIRYRPLDEPEEPDGQAAAIAAAVAELVPSGDVLVFCAGEREIREATDAIEDLGLDGLEILPLYARLAPAQQHRVFDPPRGRRVVVATNVAETSLTVPGIRSVVDSGTARISRYSRRTKVQRLPIEPVSQASADQRAGRCGRVGPGVCIRLYSEDDYLSRPAFTEPEVQRTDLASVILQLAVLGLGDVASFPFLDPPDRRSIRDGVALLEELGAVDPDAEGTRTWLTGTGRRLARLPVDPRIARMILAAGDAGCLREVTVIAAALSVPDPRQRPPDQEEAARRSHARFSGSGSDFIAWLNLWEHLRREYEARSSRAFRRMCDEEFLGHRRVREWFDVHQQLVRVADEVGLAANAQPAEPATVHRALLAGLLSHVGTVDPDGRGYRGARGARFRVSPGSELFSAAPRWVMAAELVETSRLWARTVGPVDPAWIEQVGSHLVRRSYSDPWWDRSRGTAVAGETVTLYGLPLATGRIVPYRRVDPGVARELFIRHALVEGDWDTPRRFARVNADLIAQVREMEARERRADLLVDDETLLRLFDERVPPDVTGAVDLETWINRVGEAAAGLELDLDDLLQTGATDPDPSAFPTEWRHGDLVMPVSYEFDPASPADGVTVDVPIEGLSRLDAAVFEWNVPGLRAELVEALVRSLPKAIRRQLVPVPDTVRSVLAHLDPDRGLIESVRTSLGRLSGLAIMPEDFDLGRVPRHLLPRFRVVAPDGRILAEGEDLPRLRADLADAAAEAAPRSPDRSGLTTWTVGDLDRRRTVDGQNGSVEVFPALVDDGDSVSVRTLGSEAEQWKEMWGGVRRLLILGLPNTGAALRRLVDDRAALVLRSGPYTDRAEWIDDCVTAAADAVMEESGGPVWDAAGFEALLATARRRVGTVLDEAGRASLEVLAELREVLLALEDLDDRFESAIDDVVEQLHTLVYPGFVTGVGVARLDDVARYLRAARHRLDRLPFDPQRDAGLMERVRSLESDHHRLLDSLPLSPELIEVGWQLQELRVSFFAQQLGTRGRVSEQRLRRSIESVVFG